MTALAWKNSAFDKSLLSIIHSTHNHHVHHIASMSAAYTHEQPAPVVDPVATQPIIAAEPTPETVKHIAADNSASSEGATGVDAPANALASGTTTTGPEAEAEKPVSKDEALVESQPINEGVLQYKAPGIVK